MAFRQFQIKNKLKIDIVKKILLIFIICLSFKGFSQDPQLDDNTWYLESVIINGEDHIAPVNAEITEITLDFFGAIYDFLSEMCNGLNASLSFDDNNSSFTISDMGQTLATCGMYENRIYEQLYFGFYWDNYSNPFTYNITINPDSSTLIVTAANGDQAIYGSARLHTDEFRMADIKTYPNPVIDELVIEKQSINNLNVSVYNIIGQLIHSESVGHEQSAINVSELEPDVYFFVFEDDNYKKEIRKIIKK